MAERFEHAAALHTAIDGFMGRAQDLGLVHSVGDLSTRRLLISGALASQEQSRGPLPVPRLVVTASEQQMKERPFSVAILGDKSPIAPVLVAADVSYDAAISRVGPQDEDALLPYPHIRILTDSAHTARPGYVERLAAEQLFQRIINAQYG